MQYIDKYNCWKQFDHKFVIQIREKNCKREFIQAFTFYCVFNAFTYIANPMML